MKTKLNNKIEWKTIPDIVGPDGLFVDGDWIESKDQDENGDVRLIQLADIGDGFYRDRSNRFLTKERANKLGCTFLQKGDILLARMPEPLGRACIFPGDSKPSVTAVDVCIIRPGNNSVDARWLMQAINAPHFRKKINALQSGTTRKRISRKNLGTLKIPVQSITEQKNIANEIETQFTRLDAGVAALKRAQANLKRYRAAVLKAACEGKLVQTEAELAKEEGRSYETGEQLLQRILAERKKKWEAEQKKTGGKKKYVEPKGPDVSVLPKLPKGWAWATIEQIGITTTGFTPSKKHKKYFGGDIPFLKPTDLDVGYYVKEYRDSLTKAGAEQGRILPALSILVTCIGATIGKTGLARVACTTNQQINALTVDESVLLPQYIYWLIVSPFGQNQIIKNASSTTLPILNKSRFESLLVKMPPHCEQQKIVEEVERQFSVIDKQEENIIEKLKMASNLRNAILTNSFER